VIEAPVDPSALDGVYGHRFSLVEEQAKDSIWREVARYLQRYVPEDGAVLDLACDRGEFIRNIRARERWATDLRDVRRHLPGDVTFVQSDGLELTKALPNAHFDTVFMSNYLEHLPSGEAVVEQLRVAFELTKPGGRVVVLQPNIRLTGLRYWDFIDHKTALTERSLVEAAEIAGLEQERLVVRFLPFTTKQRLPQTPALVRLYLACPPAWRLLGKQTLYVGRRP
jgi:2-polyprenyl-3-methyl-5-hydroxy-6-metoxy-1,4-benzoquinol methylase